MDLTRAASWLKGQFSLDPQANQDLLSPETGVDMVLGSVPGIGQAMALRDMERARRAGDPTAGALAATGLLPFGRLGQAAKKIIAGKGGNAAPIKNLELGEARIARGEDPDRVWNELKVYKGPDKQMKWEISDKPSRFAGREGDNFDDPVSDLLHHPELFRNYPELAEFKVRGSIAKDNPGAGSTIPTREEIEVWARTPEEFHKALLHELQHGVQHYEPRFSTGSNADYIGELLRKKSGGVPSTKEPEQAFQTYLRNMGEAEARAVEKRLRGSEQGLPTQDYDVPLDQLWKGLRDIKWQP